MNGKPQTKVELDLNNFAKLHLHTVKVEVTKDGDRVESGELLIDLSLTGHQVDKITLRYPLISTWVDRSQQGKEIVCKAHATLPAENKQDKITTIAREFAAFVNFNRMWTVYHRPEMRLFVSDDMEIIRYASSDKIYKAQTFDGNTFFENKALALQAVFKAIKNHSLKRQVTGTDVINLNAVSDGVLEEVGFVRIPDEMGVGMDMWMGDPERIITLGRTSYDETESRYDDYWKCQDKRRDSEQAVIDSFLDILELELT